MSARALIPRGYAAVPMYATPNNGISTKANFASFLQTTGNKRLLKYNRLIYIKTHRMTYFNVILFTAKKTHFKRPALVLYDVKSKYKSMRYFIKKHNRKFAITYMWHNRRHVTNICIYFTEEQGNFGPDFACCSILSF